MLVAVVIVIRCRKKEHVLVRCFMFKLAPVINSMFIVFHAPVVSGVHSILHCEPWLYTSPGPGADGTGSAKTAVTAREARRRIFENMVLCEV